MINKCPSSVEELDNLEQMIPMCRKELFVQVQSRIESGIASSISEASRQLGEETGRNPESIRRSVKREQAVRGVTLSQLAETSKYTPKVIDKEIVRMAKVITQEQTEAKKEKVKAVVVEYDERVEEKKKSGKSINIFETEEKFRVIYADPCWSYNDKQATPMLGGAEKHYDTMSIEQLSALPVDKISHDNSVLFLWVTSPLLESCFKVINAWGFQYKTSFVWDKVGHNMGHYNSVRHELLLVCTKGSCTPDEKKLFDSVQSIDKSSIHSQKPVEFLDIIDTLYVYGKKLEMFARSNDREGWQVFGNEV